MPTTLENLKEAFSGESQANRKYLAYAFKAKDEGFPNIAKLFHAAATAETIHALGHFKAMDAVKATAENLKAAVAGETYEATEMYPPMLELAQKENHRAKVMFNLALKAEAVHAKLYQRALDSAKQGRDLEQGEFYLCPVCGNIEFGKPHAQCPICGVKAERYVRIGLPEALPGEKGDGAKVTLGGNPIHTSGKLPAVGTVAPDFRLTKGDLSDVSLAEFAGKKKVLNIVPSLDTGICAASARRFNQEATSHLKAVVLLISRDLPFAQHRFCEAEGLKAVVPLSELRSDAFGADYGIRIVDGPLAGLLGRAVVILDEQNRVIYTELVPEIKQEPDYAKALAALR